MRANLGSVIVVVVAVCACAEAKPVAPAAKSGAPVEKDQLYLRAHGRTLVATCEEAQCTLWLDGAVVETVNFDDTVAEFVTPLGAFSSETSLFVVARTEGELCPRMLQLLQVNDDGAHLSEPFGNCAPLDRLEVANGATTLHFAAAPKLGRPAATYLVTMNDGAATVAPLPPPP